VKAGAKPATLPAAPREPLEVWALLSYVVGAVFALLLLYLGWRPGGPGPMFAWGQGRDLVGLVALALLATGAIWSAFHRPFLRRRRQLPFLILLFVLGAGSYPFPYPSSHEGHPSAVAFRLPVEGEWTVFWGGERKEENVLVGYTADRRFGFDLVVARDGRTHSGEGRAATDFHCFGATVLSPASGRVVRAVGAEPDQVPGTIDRSVASEGNFVVIQVAEREFLFLAHLRQGSLAVAEGAQVAAGDRIGEVGSSGWSPWTPEPHLAIHLQDTPVPRRGEAIPLRFTDYVADGVRVERGVPRGGIGPGGALLGQRIAASAR
jgi:murein DD-endopeptidase MepM/ murein hydrolase activator NlpD